MAESMAQFVARRMRETSRFGRAAEAMAHEAYRAAIRAGENLELPTAPGLMAYGANLLRAKGRDAAVAQPKPPARSGRPAAGGMWLDRSPMAKKVAGDFAVTAGRSAGVVRGGVHAVEGLGQGALFLGRLAIPALDQLVSPNQTAGEQLGAAVGGMVDYAREGLRDPQKVVGDVKAKVHQARLDLDPSASPEAATFAGEMRRLVGVGANQGELLFDLGSLAFGGPLAKSFKGLERVSKVIPAERYLAHGYKPEAIAYLDELYPSTGKGSHFVAQRFGFPKAFSDSDYNVLKPPGITRRQMYEEHARIDDHFKGARLPARFGEHWSAKRLGIERYAPAGVAWYGMPVALKARAVGLGATTGGVSHELSQEDGRW
jgi:hypothetical protein